MRSLPKRERECKLIRFTISMTDFFVPKFLSTLKLKSVLLRCIIYCSPSCILILFFSTTIKLYSSDILRYYDSFVWLSVPCCLSYFFIRLCQLVAYAAYFLISVKAKSIASKVALYKLYSSYVLRCSNFEIGNPYISNGDAHISSWGFLWCRH